jgi:hypothetical protein
MKERERKESTISVEHYWDRLKHEDSLFSSRTSIFVVAQSMLFIAFVINSYENPKITIVLGATGILFVLVWLVVSICQIYRHINRVKQKLVEKLPEYQVRRGIWLFGEPNIWLGIVFPSVLIMVWILLVI